MTLLAIDTSAQQCAACLYDVDNAHVLAKISENIGRGHAEKLMPMMAQCLKTADVSYDNISRIAVTIGPGSFTGVRVGLSAARGLALSLEVPVCGISTLEACIEEVRVAGHADTCVAIIDAKRGEAYMMIEGQIPIICSYEDIHSHLPNQKIVLCGSGAKTFNEVTDNNFSIIHEQSSGNIETIARIISHKKIEKMPVEPLYLRSADAKPQNGFTLERI